jgi:hypothetical protein
MILLAGIPDLDSSPSALTDASRRASDRDWGPRNQAWTPSGTGLPALRGIAGPQLHGIPGKRPQRQTDEAVALCQLRRLHRSRHPGQSLEGPCAGARDRGLACQHRFPLPLKDGVLEVRMPKTEEAKKNAITVTIDHVLVSQVSSHERSSRHG